MEQLEVYAPRVIELLHQLNDTGCCEFLCEPYSHGLSSLANEECFREEVDRMKKKIDKYNEKKGYRWEIQKVIVLKQNLPKLENGQVDGEAIQEMLETGQY